MRRQRLGAIRTSPKPVGKRRGSSIGDVQSLCDVISLREIQFHIQPESTMSMQRIFGIVLLSMGIALLITGMNASHSAADQISNTFAGRFTHETVWYLVGAEPPPCWGFLWPLSGAALGTA